MSAASLTPVLVIAYSLTLAPGLTWANQGDDGGDLITAAAVLGVAHPTGYPAYLLLAKAFQWLPLGNLAYRTALLSAASAIGAALAVRALVIQLRSPGEDSAVSEAAGWFAGTAFGFSALLWSQAVIAEVYTLHALGLALILLGLARLTQRASLGNADRLVALAAGLALGNHLTTLWLLPLYLAALLWRSARLPRRFAASLWLLFLLGLAVYLYLPLRAAAQPPINWGGVHTLPGLWWLVSAQAYREYAFGISAGEILPRVADYFIRLLQQFGWVGLGLGLGGVLVSLKARLVRAALLWLAVIASAFALGYQTASYFVYLLPLYLAFAVWLGLGWGALLDRARRWPGAARVGLMAAGLVWLAVQAALTGPLVSARTDQRAESFLREVFQRAPSGALIATRSDRDTFALWYGRFAARERLDLIVVVESLLVYPWYRENLRAVYSGLTVPEDSALSADRLAAVNDRALCRTQLDTEPPLLCPPTP